MTIKWAGHVAHMLQNETGTKIMMDHPGRQWKRYKPKMGRLN